MTPCTSAQRHSRVEKGLCLQFQEQQQPAAGAHSQSRPECSQQHHPACRAGLRQLSPEQMLGGGWILRAAATFGQIQHPGEQQQPSGCSCRAHSAKPLEHFSTTDSSQDLASGRRVERAARSSGQRRQSCLWVGSLRCVPPPPRTPSSGRGALPKRTWIHQAICSFRSATKKCC